MSAFVFLHGFFQDSRIWLPLKSDLEYRGHAVFTPDLPGFGTHQLNNEHELLTDAQVFWLQQYVESLHQSKLIVVGYSMGARLLLQALHQLHDLVDGLIVESGTNGISDDIERITRRENDFRLAQFALSDFSGFQKFWENHPALQPVKTIEDHELQQIREIQLSQKPQYVSWSLMHFGTGSMPFLPKSFFSSFTKPVLFLAGEQDTKFAKKAKELARLNPLFFCEIISNCGHRVHLEQRELYVKQLETFHKHIRP